MSSFFSVTSAAFPPVRSGIECRHEESPVRVNWLGAASQVGTDG
jgi:hypothetical protein